MDMRLKRNSYCGEIIDQEIGKEITVMGWVQRTRDMGGIIFLDIRDKTGILQVVFDEKYIGQESFEESESLRNEDVVAVKGIIERRDEETYNPNIPTGTVELRATCLEVLSESKNLPFPIENNINVREELRLEYRYLDIRRPDLYKNLKLRHETVKVIRNYLEKKGFMEVETPILTKSTPEGARDYLVPSRLNKGEFYALPQSPQVFKQLLMVSGIDKYYQIARCFRDEDLRSDRQPEFTQVDLELSFVEQEDILMELEGLFKDIFKEVIGEEIEEDFVRMTYQEAMDKYGTDKPDLRFGMEIVELNHLLKSCGFKVFRDVIKSGGAVRAINIPGGNSFSRNQIDELTEKAISYGAKGMAWISIEPDGELRTLLNKFLTEKEIENIISELGSKPGDLIVFCADELVVVHKTLGNLRLDIADMLDLKDKNKYKFLIVTDFPLLEWSEEEKRYVAMHHPFTMPADVEKFLEGKELSTINAKSYDIVLNGTELGSGSIRIHRKEIQEKMFEILGLNEAEIENRFGFLTKAFSYGTPPHGGFAFGLDRLIMIMANTDSIRDVIAFPKTRDAACLLTNAPSLIDTEQLEELNIYISEDGIDRIRLEGLENEKALKYDLDKLADLSELIISEEEKNQYEDRMEELINSTSKIKKINTDGIKATIHLNCIKNVTRLDQVKKEFTAEELIKNAPTTKESYILVPNVME